MSQTSYLEKYGTVAGAPWQEGKALIVRFVTDDHKVIGVMFGHITRTYEDRLSNYLMVSSSAGVIVIRGPGVSAYHEKLAQGIADLVEANGKEITSVLYYPPAYGESDEELDEETIAESK
jgi:hypothetical protein